MAARRWWLCLIVLVGSCAPVQAPAPEPSPVPDHYTIPLAARNGDFVCAETLPKLPNLCMRVERFRRILTDAYAEP